MKNLEKLRKIIIKEIPEIVELKFGCEVMKPVPTQPHFIKRKVIDYLPVEDLLYYDNGRYIGILNNASLIYSGGDKIIGRPIRLSDVLRTINNRNYFLAVSATGAIYNHITEEAKEDENGKNIIWNLEKDNLNDQSPETIEFLYKILKA